MPRKYRPKNRYYRASKISERKFASVIFMFTQGIPSPEIARATGLSLRSINELLIKLRRRVFEDVRLDPFRLVHGEYNRPPADSIFWEKYRACLYDCPTLRAEVYPEPAAKAVNTLWHPPDYEEWCSECGILHHRRHPYWGPLEVWSRINHGLPKATFAHHVIYVVLLGYTQIIRPIDWRQMILDVLARDPL